MNYECPHCNSLIDFQLLVSPAEPSRRPRAGDRVICLYCGAVLEVREDRFVEITTEEACKHLHPHDCELLHLARNEILSERNPDRIDKLAKAGDDPFKAQWRPPAVTS